MLKRVVSTFFDVVKFNQNLQFARVNNFFFLHIYSVYIVFVNFNEKNKLFLFNNFLINNFITKTITLEPTVLNHIRIL